MKKQLMNYEKLLKVTKAISHSKDPEEIAIITVEGIKTTLEAKGCTLFLFDRKKEQLVIGASSGLSDEYINKGPLKVLPELTESLRQGEVLAIYDVLNDPRIQYPKEARKEGITSLLSVPIIVSGNLIGVLRVYTIEPWEFTLGDVNFVQALAQIAGISLTMARHIRGLKNSIDVLKTMREVQARSTTRKTPYEGVPVSVSSDELNR
jgi:GAF domain-containing protein